MSNQVLMVTGASRGIGAAIALSAAKELGWAICINYVSNQIAAQKVAEDIIAAGGRAEIVQGNVASAEDIKRIFLHADKMGTLAGLVNNAGVMDGIVRVEDATAAQIERTFAINVTGSILCAAEAIKRMSSRHGGNGGSIVNVTSVAAKLGAPGKRVHYAASKGAIDTFTLGLALEVADEKIRVNSVRPGVIETEIHAASGDPGRLAEVARSIPVGRTGTAEEVAEAVSWLLSDKSAYTTGSVVTVSGGRGLAV